jgi:hypothetical protein
MYRVALSRGRVSDMANLSWAKDAVTAAAIRELAYEGVQLTFKKPSKTGGHFRQHRRR